MGYLVLQILQDGSITIGVLMRMVKSEVVQANKRTYHFPLETILETVLIFQHHLEIIVIPTII